MTATTRHLDADTFRSDMRHVIRWHQLMREAEELATVTGEGLAPVWGYIRRGNYVAARSTLDELVQQLETDRHRLDKLEQDALPIPAEGTA